MKSFSVDILASSSRGNAIVLSDGQSKLLLDAGIPFSKLTDRVRLTTVDAVLISHEHQDHCRAVSDIERRGLSLLVMSDGTGKAINNGRNNLLKIRYETAVSEVELRIKDWVITPFSIVHDANEPLGFLIESTKIQKKACYIIDSDDIEYSFPGIHTWIVECNHSEAILSESDAHPVHKKRVVESHFSLEDLIRFFKDQDLSKSEEVYLVHLSPTNSDEPLFKREIMAATGLPVYTVNDNPYIDSKSTTL